MNEQQQVLQDMMNAYQAEKTRNMQLQMHQAQSSMFSREKEENLIQWQLDLNEDLERIEHILRGHQYKRDREGNEYWVDSESEDDKPFNEHGVQMLLKVMLFYLNRNTLLSNYDEKTINWKVLDFSTELIDLIHNNYQNMGMDTSEKLKLYPMIVQALVDTVHSAYLRAFNAGERDSLRTARTVTQTDNANMQMGMQNPFQTQKKSSFWNPFSWGRN